MFLQLENFSPSMGKFSERWRLHKRCKQGNYRASSFISSLECHFEGEHLHSWFFITLRRQQRILYQSNSLPQKEQHRVKGGWTAPRLLSETSVPPVSDLRFSHHSFLLTTCWDLPGFPPPFSFSVAMRSRGTWKYGIPYWRWFGHEN